MKGPVGPFGVISGSPKLLVPQNSHPLPVATWAEQGEVVAHGTGRCCRDISKTSADREGRALCEASLYLLDTFLEGFAAQGGTQIQGKVCARGESFVLQ